MFWFPLTACFAMREFSQLLNTNALHVDGASVFKVTSQMSPDFISITTLRGWPGRLACPKVERRKPPIRADGLTLRQDHATTGAEQSQTPAQASLCAPPSAFASSSPPGKPAPLKKMIVLVCV